MAKKAKKAPRKKPAPKISKKVPRTTKKAVGNKAATRNGEAEKSAEEERLLVSDLSPTERDTFLDCFCESLPKYFGTISAQSGGKLISSGKEAVLEDAAQRAQEMGLVLKKGKARYKLYLVEDDEIPKSGRRLVVVVIVDGKMRFIIWDGRGKIAAEGAESRIPKGSLVRVRELVMNRERKEKLEKKKSDEIVRLVLSAFAFEPERVQTAAPTRSFDLYLAELFNRKSLRISPGRLAEIEGRLTEQLPKIIGGITVAAGNSAVLYNEVAARKFIERISFVCRRRASERVGEQRVTIYIGLMSGSTTQGVVEGLTDLIWEDYIPDLKSFRFVIVPLNMGFMDADHLPASSTILTHSLAKIINVKGGFAVAHGLSAPLFLPKGALGAADEQAKNVLEITEPARAGGPKDADSRLDVVLTGVGGIRSDEGSEEQAEDSLFYQLAQDKKYDNYEQVVGDLGFHALTYSGKAAKLYDGDTEVMFYSSISLETLQKLAKNAEKSVVLVARRSQSRQDKVPITYASVGGSSNSGRPYVSTLIIDEHIGKHLLFRYLD